MNLINEDDEKQKALNFEISEENLTHSSAGTIITNGIIYEKYDKNLNNRPDYECIRTLYVISWLHYLVLIFVIIVFCVWLCLPEIDISGFDKIFIYISGYLSFISSILFTLIPISIKYTISSSKKLFTYQYMSFIPNICLIKVNRINIEDAAYFREDLKLIKFITNIPNYYLKLIKVNKNNEEEVLINFGLWSPNNNDSQRKTLYRVQKMARLLNDIIGFDINIIKNIQKAYDNKDNVTLQKIADEMDQDKKVLYQNLLNKLGIDIKLL